MTKTGATPGTFVSATGGTFESDTGGGTFESDTGGTFIPLLSVQVLVRSSDILSPILFWDIIGLISLAWKFVDKIIVN